MAVVITVELDQVVDGFSRKGRLVIEKQTKPLLQPVAMSDIIGFIPRKTVVVDCDQQGCKRDNKYSNSNHVFRLNFHFDIDGISDF